MLQPQCPHRLVVRTSRCGRDNPGSNPGVDRASCTAASIRPLFCDGCRSAVSLEPLPVTAFVASGWQYCSLPGNCGQRNSWVAAASSLQCATPCNHGTMWPHPSAFSTHVCGQAMLQPQCPHRLVVRTSRCGRNNPGSNPGVDRLS